MVLNTYGLQCVQGLLFGFGSIAVVTVLLLGISRILKDSFDLGEDE